jgi:ribosomal subunit interface protein
MILPLELRQKDVTLPPAMADDVRERAYRLERHVDRITRCRVTLSGPGKHHRQGRYSVQIDLCVPGAEIVIRKQEELNLELALKKAFESAERRLGDRQSRKRGFVRMHA